MSPNHTPRIAGELLVTADALRQVASQIEFLERAGHAGVAGTAEAVIVACNAPPVIQALETLGQRLAIET